MFPIEIESLIRKKVLFKVQVKSENIRMRSDVFTVMWLTEDPNVIARHVGSGDQRQVGYSLAFCLLKLFIYSGLTVHIYSYEFRSRTYFRSLRKLKLMMRRFSDKY